MISCSSCGDNSQKECKNGKCLTWGFDGNYLRGRCSDGTELEPLNLDAWLKQHESTATELEEFNARLTSIENAIVSMSADITSLKTRVSAIESSGLVAAIELLSSRVDKLYSWLPVTHAEVETKGWKFAMGNINIMSGNSGTAAITGPGVFTSGSIENNDLYFN